jgi:hypothetical protein
MSLATCVALPLPFAFHPNIFFLFSLPCHASIEVDCRSEFLVNHFVYLRLRPRDSELHWFLVQKRFLCRSLDQYISQNQFF